MRQVNDVVVAKSDMLPEDVGLAARTNWWHPAADKPLRLIVLSEHHLGALLHFTKLGLTAHTQPHCVWCEAGLGIQFRAYIYCKAANGEQFGILELRSPQLQWLRDCQNGSGPLRGTVIELTRAGEKTKGKVIIRTVSRIKDTETLPKPVDLSTVLIPRWRGRGTK